MTRFDPFADNAASTEIGGLTIENGSDRVALYGSLDIARDAEGLQAARRLKALLDATVAALEAGPLDGPAPVEAPVRVANPFA